MNPHNPKLSPVESPELETDYDELDDEYEDDESSSSHEDNEEDYVESDEDTASFPASKKPAAPTTRGRGLRNHVSDDEEEEDTGPSKTKIKKQMHELRDLGEELTELSKDQVSQLDLPENLKDAIRAMRNIPSFGAKRRQVQYIGKLMRDIDPAPIIAKLDAWKGKSQGHTAYMHQLERWRDRLLEDDSAFTELLAAHPQADAQRLRSLIRNAKKEREQGKPPKNFRDIFQVLREILPEPV